MNHPPITYSDISWKHWKDHVSFLVVLPTRDIDNYNQHATLHPINAGDTSQVSLPPGPLTFEVPLADQADSIFLHSNVMS